MQTVSSGVRTEMRSAFVAFGRPVKQSCKIAAGVNGPRLIGNDVGFRAVDRPSRCDLVPADRAEGALRPPPTPPSPQTHHSSPPYEVTCTEPRLHMGFLLFNIPHENVLRIIITFFCLFNIQCWNAVFFDHLPEYM